jgi:hypothetical protein
MEQRWRYALRTFEGVRMGDRDTVYDSLASAIAGFIETPGAKLPRVVDGERTLIERDPAAGMAIVFRSAHAEAMYRRVETAAIGAGRRAKVPSEETQGRASGKGRRCDNPACLKSLAGLPDGQRFCCLSCAVARGKRKPWKVMARDFDALAPHVFSKLDIKEAVRLVLVRRKSAAQASAITGISVRRVERAAADFLDRLKRRPVP